MKRSYLNIDYVNSFSEIEKIKKNKKHCDLNINILNWSDTLEFGPYEDIHNNNYFNIQILIEGSYLLEHTNNLESINNIDKKYYKLPPFLDEEYLLALNWFKIPTEDKKRKTIIKSYNLNYGGTSLVFRGLRKKDQASVAFKVFNENTSLKIYQNEVKILDIFKKNGNHPYIIEMYEDGIIDQDLFDNFDIPPFINKDFFQKSKYILLEWIEGQELFEYISKDNIISHNYIKNIINQVIEGIRWANEKCLVINEDIKLENIMISQKEPTKIKIIDWGFSTTEEMSSNLLGSENYCSPEILKKPFKIYNSKKSQMWSLGITIYALVFKSFPFDTANILDNRFKKFYKLQENDNMFNITEFRRRQYLLIVNEEQYLDIFDLINKMLICDPSKRLNNLNNINLKI